MIEFTHGQDNEQLFCGKGKEAAGNPASETLNQYIRFGTDSLSVFSVSGDLEPERPMDFPRMQADCKKSASIAEETGSAR